MSLWEIKNAFFIKEGATIEERLTPYFDIISEKGYIVLFDKVFIKQGLRQLSESEIIELLKEVE